MTAAVSAAPRMAFSVFEVADQLGVHHFTIRRAVKAGKLRAFYVGRQLRISAQALSEYTGEDQID